MNRIMRSLIWLIVVVMPASGLLHAALPNLFKKQVLPAPPAIKVLIAHDKIGALIEVKGKYRIYDPKTNECLGLRYLGKRKYMQALCEGLQWGEEFPGVHQLLIVPDNQEITTVVDGIEYRGSLYVYDVEGYIHIVNEVDIEDFLHSMLAPLGQESHPEETLAAIAIASRTGAYYLKQNPKSAFWAVDGSKIGYQGYAVTNVRSELDTAIIATRYLIMTQGLTQEGKAIPFPALWKEHEKAFPGQTIPAQVSLAQADEMSKRGDNAAHILSKAFPNSTIVLMYAAEMKAVAK